MKVYLGIDIGGTFIKYGIVNSTGKILFKDKVPTDRVKPEAVLNSIVEIINNQKKNYTISGVGLSIPGVITSKNKLITSGAIQNMYQYDVVGILTKKTNTEVRMVNDANAIAYAEKWVGLGQKCKNFVCLPLGTGVGGSIVIDGKVIKGRTGAAGEFGMMLMRLGHKDPVGYDSSSFYCGAIAGLCRIYNLKLGIKEFSKWERDIRVIIEKSRSGQKEASESLAEFYHNVSVLLLNISVSIDPEMILIGGGISENEIIMGGIKQAYYELLKRYEDVSALGMPIIKSCELKNTAGIIGAVAPFVI